MTLVLALHTASHMSGHCRGYEAGEELWDYNLLVCSRDIGGVLLKEPESSSPTGTQWIGACGRLPGYHNGDMLQYSTG